jgi:hypothetical protein
MMTTFLALYDAGYLALEQNTHLLARQRCHRNLHTQARDCKQAYLQMHFESWCHAKISKIIVLFVKKS